MRDPHVERLIYRLELRLPGASFANPPAVVVESGDFSVRLSNDELVVTMVRHFADDVAARDVVDPYLRAWEASAFLEGRDIVFVFQRAFVVDRDPPDGGIGLAMADSVVVGLALAASGTDYHEIGLYPDPPRHFSWDTHVEAMYAHLRAYRQGRERQTDCAYAMYTYVTCVVADTPRDAAKALGLSNEVLNELRRLSSSVGDSASVRKFSRRWVDEPLSPNQIRWLDVVIVEIVRRLGALAANEVDSLPRLALGDLPSRE